MNKEIAIFSTDKETINVEVLFEDETVWLTQEQIFASYSPETVRKVMQDGKE